MQPCEWGEECPGCVFPKGRSCVCCWAQTGGVMGQSSSIRDIWLGNGNPCLEWICPALRDLLGAQTPAQSDLPLVIVDRASAGLCSQSAAGVRRDRNVHEGTSTEFLAQGQFTTCSSPKLDVQPCPARPEQGLKGWNLAQTLPFLPEQN